jgi:hypothetical protein
MGVQPAANYSVSVFGVMNLTAAAILLECWSALVEGQAACRAALTKHQASIGSEVVQALEEVGRYTTSKVIFIISPPFPHGRSAFLISAAVTFLT